MQTLPKWGMTRNGELFRLPTPERLTSGSGGGAWPTPDAKGFVGTGALKMLAEKACDREEWLGMATRSAVSRREAVWPTPTVRESEPHDAKLTPNGRRISKDGKSGHSLNLADTVRIAESQNTLWPTPNVHGFTNEGSLKKLANAVADKAEYSAMAYRAGANMKDRLWPTPMANDAKNRANEGQFNRVTVPLNCVVAEKRGDALNPDWTEWLMGWPLHWTHLSSADAPRYFECWEQQMKRGEWWDADPSESALCGSIIPRVTNDSTNRCNRIRLLGNGQVPKALELFWRLMTDHT